MNKTTDTRLDTFNEYFKKYQTECDNLDFNVFTLNKEVLNHIRKTVYLDDYLDFATQLDAYYELLTVKNIADLSWWNDGFKSVLYELGLYCDHMKAEGLIYWYKYVAGEDHEFLNMSLEEFDQIGAENV